MRQKLSVATLQANQTSNEVTLVKTYNAAMSSAAAELLQLWGAGYPHPGEDAHLQVVKLVTAEREVRGFGVYLVGDEPQVLGPMREEAL